MHRGDDGAREGEDDHGGWRAHAKREGGGATFGGDATRVARRVLDVTGNEWGCFPHDRSIGRSVDLVES